MASLSEIWDELDNEERATVGAQTRVRLGLDRPVRPGSWQKMVDAMAEQRRQQKES